MIGVPKALSDRLRAALTVPWASRPDPATLAAELEDIADAFDALIAERDQLINAHDAIREAFGVAWPEHLS